MPYRYDTIDGLRLYYRFIINGFKAYNLKRFGIYQTDFYGTGDRNKDRTLYSIFLLEEHGLYLEDFSDYEIHHHLDNTMMLIPKELHRKIHHAGSISMLKHAS